MITNRKTKGKSKNVDSRLKISGMTREEVIPEWFYHPCPSPLSVSIRGPQHLRIFRCLAKFQA